MNVLMQNVCFVCLILTKIGKYCDITLKIPRMKVHENPSDGSRAVGYGQRDGRIDVQTWQS
jgi:hypothetical protein